MTTAAAPVRSKRAGVRVDSLMDRLIAKWAKPARILLIHEAHAAAETYGITASQDAALDAVEVGLWLAYLNRLWLSTVPIVGNTVLSQLPAAPAAPVAGDPFVRAAARWLQQNGADRVGAIAGTSREQIAEQIATGLLKGESTQQIAARIQQHGRDIAPARAEAIAGTEVHAATNYASLVGAAESTQPLVKIWRTRADGRVRAAHVAAHGQRQPLDGRFNVGGYQMRYPGDPAAPPSLTVRCRCMMTYDVVAVARPASRVA
jgi:Phage Mu protein F like protein